MRSQKTCILALVTFLTTVSTSPSLFFSLPLSAQQTSDQAQDPRKAKAHELFEQGQQQIEARQFDSARQLLQQALNIYQMIKDPTGEFAALWTIGQSYQKQENFPEAIKYYQRSSSPQPPTRHPRTRKISP
ncbi:tetratricopeptide repeat protein [Phormidesmis priestleyi ULC007]|uniref:Tetratricopeptide repeat protein n=1 Tax=Phormidesmis priestleyi ULC007 TaxID=1920490 RepID=A0A2T1DHS4_9CYAN|nr:tetratricopeptide repeat protein [Phormidesmis priestleyi]PSB20060.1 tetratricopeptide repeat protein [Phormidesmis priestleyi ULC007]PZO48924.1 MAG: tetratricopeptide repeat protein [Phormidesmis priestleyi]